MRFEERGGARLVKIWKMRFTNLGNRRRSEVPIVVNFSQQVLDYTVEADRMPNPNPFDVEEDEEEGGLTAASGAYRYRKLVLPGNPNANDETHKKNVTVLLRAEVDCKMPGGEYSSVKALNEYDTKVGLSWRTHLDSQRGAVLATELKNNAFKLARFTAQAMIAGCDVLKLGYVTRSQPQDPWSHCILGVQTYSTDGFAAHIGMTAQNAYGILRHIIDLLLPLEDGKFVLVKDPTKPVVRLYSVPWETFDDKQEGDEKPAPSAWGKPADAEERMRKRSEKEEEEINREEQRRRELVHGRMEEKEAERTAT